MREYWVEIWPTAKTFSAGHRLRIDIYSADTPNHLNLARPSLNEIVTGEDSYLLLSVVDQPTASGSSRQDSASKAGGGMLHWSLIIAGIGLLRLRRCKPDVAGGSSPLHPRACPAWRSAAKVLGQAVSSRRPLARLLGPIRTGSVLCLMGEIVQIS